jgi:hypothetical protein
LRQPSGGQHPARTTTQQNQLLARHGLRQQPMGNLSGRRCPSRL